MTATLTEAAPAKVNLALHVRRRRADGYHALETIFAFTELGDRLEAEPAEALALEVDGPFAGGLAAEPDNLVLRAARALAAAASAEPRARLRLVKALPVAAGLGGGSADAAAALRLLMRLWGVRLAPDRLAAIALGLGADVPACLASTPARGEGLGEELSPVALPALPILLVNPGVPVPTGPVFARWDGVDRGPLAHGDALAAALAGRNDLEPPAIAVAPAVGEALAALSAQDGAGLVRMSGSGATCLALFASDAACAAAAAAIAAARPGWWVAPTRLRGAA